MTISSITYTRNGLATDPANGIAVAEREDSFTKASLIPRTSASSEGNTSVGIDPRAIGDDGITADDAVGKISVRVVGFAVVNKICPKRRIDHGTKIRGGVIAVIKFLDANHVGF